MTPEEFNKKMQEISEGWDEEQNHVEGDVLLVNLIQSLDKKNKYAEGLKIFDEMTKWYA